MRPHFVHENRKLSEAEIRNALYLFLKLRQSDTFRQLSQEVYGFLGMGNNPMVGATVAVAVAVEESRK